MAGRHHTVHVLCFFVTVTLPSTVLWSSLSLVVEPGGEFYILCTMVIFDWSCDMCSEVTSISPHRSYMCHDLWDLSLSLISIPHHARFSSHLWFHGVWLALSGRCYKTQNWHIQCRNLHWLRFEWHCHLCNDTSPLLPLDWQKKGCWQEFVPHVWPHHWYHPVNSSWWVLGQPLNYLLKA